MQNKGNSELKEHQCQNLPLNIRRSTIKIYLKQEASNGMQKGLQFKKSLHLFLSYLPEEGYLL
jgi:hypothetical protein